MFNLSICTVRARYETPAVYLAINKLLAVLCDVILYVLKNVLITLSLPKDWHLPYDSSTPCKQPASFEL